MMVHLNCCSSLVFEEKGLELIAVIRMQQGKNPVNEYEQKEDPREEVGRHFALSDRPRQRPQHLLCATGLREMGLYTRSPRRAAFS